MRRPSAAGTVLILSTLCPPLPAGDGTAVDPAALDFFEKRVRPVLAENCFRCHGPERQKANLRLDHISTILLGSDNGPVVASGDPERSRLIEAIRYQNPHLQMPPKSKLPDGAIADLAAWVKLGLPWPAEAPPLARAAPKRDGVKEGSSDPRAQAASVTFDLAERKARHWAWRPLLRAEPPEVRDGSWPAGAIDRFVLSKLEEKGLSPAPDAERRVLIRRLSFDLLGLPPDPERVEAFASSLDPEALERLVDSLLASPRFGERWGRHWLDLVRYAETYGHEFDYTIHGAHRYRDYVIRALNDDLPYDRFLEEHLAGDLLESPRRDLEGFEESVIGTGFFWLGEQTHSPVDVREHGVHRVDNQIDVLSKAFLGLTVSCARCHDHKFDAISSSDYYALCGILESSRYRQAAIDPPARTAPALARLRELRARLQGSIAASLRARAADLAKELHAAREVLRGEPRPTDRSAPPDDLILEGNALFAPFTLERPYVHCLLQRAGAGAGPSGGPAEVRILVEGKSTRSAVAGEPGRGRTARLEAGDLLGSSARLEIAPRGQGEGARPALELVVLSRRANVFDEAGALVRLRRPIAAAAAEGGVDPGALERLLDELVSPAVKDPAHPLHAWRREAIAGEAPPPAPKTMPPRLAPGSELLADFRGALAGDDAAGRSGAWLPEGPAFEEVPARNGTLILLPADPPGAARTPVRLLLAGWATSGALANRLQGGLRSPTFTLEKRFVHLRVLGRDARINLVIDGYTLIRDPIYGGLKRGVGNLKPHWITFDAAAWKGHRAYLELLDRTSPDPTEEGPRGPEGLIAVERVILSDEGPPPDAAPSILLALAGEKSPAGAAQKESIPDLARRLQRVVEESIDAWDGRGPSDPVLAAAREELLDWFLARSPPAPETDRLLEEIRAAEADLGEPRTVLAMIEGNGLDSPRLVRGNHRSPGPAVPRGFLEALDGGDRSGYERGSGRRELARRLIDPARSPIVPRVLVNRVWGHLFGRGIVPTVDNLGVQGGTPTHPELLDHLAEEFVQDGWSLKRLVRRIVLSRTYRMASRAERPAGSSAAEEKDPANALLHRAPVRRLEGEALRDAILAVSGRIDLRAGGPPVRVHLTPFLEGRGRPGESGPLDGAGRRSVYLELRRNFLSPLMQAFDAPVPFSTAGGRGVSNVPAQALILLNDPFVIEEARRWAEALLRQGGATPAERVATAYRRAFARPPETSETERAIEFLRAQGEALGLAKDASLQDSRIWADLCHVLFNAKEFCFIQ